MAYSWYIFKQNKNSNRIFIAILKIKHLKIYSSLDDARRIIKRAVKKSKKIKFISIRGFPVTQETYSLHQAITDGYNPSVNEEFKVMLIDPESDNARHRAEEYSHIGVEETETYLKQIRNSINVVKNMKNIYRTLELKTHDSPALYRILIFDDFCLIGYYTKEIKGATSPIVYIEESSFLYKSYERYFDLQWENGTEITDELPLDLNEIPENLQEPNIERPNNEANT